MKVLVASVLSLIFSDLFYGCSSSESSGEETLQSVHVVFRHGQKVDDEVHMDGLLRQEGKAEMYELGRFTRDRYPNLLKAEYDPGEIEILSSGVNRCVQSGALFAYGLYHERNQHANWSRSRHIPYEPVPVQTIPAEYDRYLQLAEECPRREEIKKEIEGKNDAKFVKDNQDFIGAYVNATGDLRILDETVSVAERVTPLYRRSGVDAGAGIPEWARPYVNRFQESQQNVNRELRKSSEYRRLHAGPLVGLLIDRISGGADSKKLYAYAAHDITLIALATGLLLDPRKVPAIPPTGSVFLLEVHQEPDESEEYLKIYFRGKPSEPLMQLSITDCTPVCYTSLLSKLFANIIPVDYAEECSRT